MSETSRALLLPGLDGSGALFGPLLQVLPPWLSAQPATYPTEVWRYDELLTRLRDEVARSRPAVRIAESFSGPLAVRLAAEEPPGLSVVVLVASFLACPRLRFMRPLVRPALFALPPPTTLLRRLLLASDASSTSMCNWSSAMDSATAVWWVRRSAAPRVANALPCRGVRPSLAVSGRLRGSRRHEPWGAVAPVRRRRDGARLSAREGRRAKRHAPPEALAAQSVIGCPAASWCLARRGTPREVALG